MLCLFLRPPSGTTWSCVNNHLQRKGGAVSKATFDKKVGPSQPKSFTDGTLERVEQIRLDLERPLGKHAAKRGRLPLLQVRPDRWGDGLATLLPAHRKLHT